ncbi:uncharacterized protein N7483_006951 [Penicillium malachiteum]|uniref:uncharacterized protein n=1 Tax=Penicillium malachiteum TaxID=1324776 RepID=UPI0025476561|nr:uncharacterized protein N7483_006951 [Penicillium malachiteum]KAJ5725594.1 hypothetical protein N7483_006951 [Penicillium malachiteum]
MPVRFWRKNKTRIESSVEKQRTDTPPTHTSTDSAAGAGYQPAPSSTTPADLTENKTPSQDNPLEKKGQTARIPFQSFGDYLDAHHAADGSLWEQAFEELRKDEPDLVASFERVVDSEDDSNSGHVHASGQDRQQRMAALVDKKIAQMNDRKWRLSIGKTDIEVREKVDQIVKIIMVAKDFVSSAASIDPVHVGLPWAGICVLLPLLVNDTTQRDDALAGLKTISELVRRFTEVERLYLKDEQETTSQSLERSIVNLYRQVLEYEARAACQFNRNTALQIARSIITADNWKSILDKIKMAEADCEKVMRLLDAKDQRSRFHSLESTIEAQNRRVEDILTDLSRWDKMQEEILAETKGIKKQAEEFRHSDTERQVLELLRTTDYAMLKDRNPARVPNTCQWFLQHQDFLDWKDITKQKSLLWVSADPGCGKSVLAKSLVENELRPTDSRTTCYFFFKDDNDVQKSLTSALCAFLHQLFGQKPWLIKHALPDFSKEGKKLSEITSKLWDILIQASMDPAANEVIYIIDALDECEKTNRRQLLDNLSHIFENQTLGDGKIKFLVTSRPYFDIERSFRTMIQSSNMIRLEGEKESDAISDEIDLVIERQVPEIGRMIELSQKEEALLLEQLLSIPHRTYLWLKLIFEFIQEELSLKTKTIRQITALIPDSLEKTYNAILDKSTDTERTRKLLFVIVSATRPLSLREMRIALAIERDSRSYDDLDLEKKSTFATVVRNLCGLFINIVDDHIYLIHQTAKEFLLSEKTIKSDSWKHSLNPVEGHLVMAEICVAYLCFTEFEETMSSADLEADELMNTHQLLWYAATCWHAHVRQAQYKCDSELTSLVFSLCDSRSSGFEAWVSVLRPMLEIDGFAYWESRTPLMVLSGFGLHTLAKTLLDSLGESPNKRKSRASGGATMNAKDDEGRTALFLAAQNGHTETVKVLIEYGADLGVPNEMGTTPLAAAARSPLGAETVEYLLDCGADMQTTELNSGYSPLVSCLRSLQGPSIRTIKAFLDKGAGLESQDNSGWTILFHAGSTNNEEIINYLLSYGAELNHQDFSGNTPLIHTVLGVWPRAFQALLNAGADVNIVDCDGRNALFHCARSQVFEFEEQPYYDMAAALIEHGADTEVEDYRHRTALLVACKGSTGGKKTIFPRAILELLLKAGTNIEHKDWDGKSALSLAVEEGHNEIVQLLISRHADLESRDKSLSTPLSHAAREGRYSTAKILIENGADINAVDNMGDTPLGIAIGQFRRENLKNRHGKPGLTLKQRMLNEVAGLLLLCGADYSLIEEGDRAMLELMAEEAEYEIPHLSGIRGVDVSVAQLNAPTDRRRSM